MEESKRIELFYGWDAVAQLGNLDTAQLARYDPFWAESLADGSIDQLLLNDAAALVVVDEGKAWAVIEPLEKEAGRVLHVLGAACADSRSFRAGDVFIEALARYAGCMKITFGTRRRGWERLAKRYGFENEGDGYYWKDVA